jgi:hypothetical protein
VPHKESLRQRWRKTTVANQAMVISTSLVALGTFFLAIAAVFQYLSAREQARTAREAMVATSRPYLSVSISAGQPMGVEVNKPVETTLILVNDGATPASDVVIRAQYRFSDSPSWPYEKGWVDAPSQDDFSFPNALLPTSIAPHDKMPLTLKSGRGLTPEDLALLRGLDIKHNLIVYGEGTYIGLGGVYPISFCFHYSYNRLTQESSWPECLNLNLKKESWKY